MDKITPEILAHCKGCRFRVGGSYLVYKDRWICNYSEMTGHLRGCPIEGCTKKDTKKRRRKKRATNDAIFPDGRKEGPETVLEGRVQHEGKEDHGE